MGRLLLALLSLAATLLALEIALRLFGGPEEASHAMYSFHRSDPELGWIGRPALEKRFVSREFDVLVEHDAEGFRRPEPPLPAAPAQRILVLGDSFTWGSGVGQGEVFTDHLQRALGPEVAVVNRGVNAFSTGQEYLLLQRELAARRYDLVLLQFTPNDVADNVDEKGGRRPWFELEEGALVARNPHPRPLMGSFDRLLREHSRLYSLVSFRFSLLKRGADRKKTVAERGVRHQDLRETPGYGVTGALLAAMDELADDHGAAFFLLYAHPGDPLAYAATEALCRRAGVGFLDLVPTLLAREEPSFTFVYNRHWTASGHRAVAAALREAEPFVAWLAGAAGLNGRADADPVAARGPAPR